MAHYRAVSDENATRSAVDRVSAVAYAVRDDDSRPHLVGLAPRAERERRLLT
jgi:hypothetical protein